MPSGKITTTSPRSRISRAVAIASPSALPRSIGKAPSEFKNQAVSGLRNSSFLATKYTGRRTIVPMTNGSRNERWLAAMIIGPSCSTCSRPMRLMRKYRWKNGWKTARTIQYRIGLTPRRRARSR